MNPIRCGAFVALLLLCFAAGAAAQSFVNFEGKQVSPIRFSPDGSRLFAVNTPDNRLSVFDVSNPLNPVLIAEIPVGLEPVSVNPLSNDEAWVVNEVSDSVSVVSVSRHVVTDTIYVKDEPGDLVFANGRAFVSASRNNRITVIDQTSHVVVTNIPVFGEHPRAMAVGLDGTKVYAAFALSGNRTTIIPLGTPGLPPQPTNGMRSGLPPPPVVSLIVDATDPSWNPSVINYSMPDNDVVEIDAATLAITRYFPRVGTVNMALAVHPNSGDLYVANTDARNLTRFEPVIRGSFVTNQISRIDINSGAVTRYNLNPTAQSTTNFPSLPDLTNALAQPTAIAFGPSGNNFYVAAFGSDRVAQVDANSGTVIARIELSPTAAGSAVDPRNKRGPRGLALKPGVALYVANRLANTLTVINATNRAVVREIPIGSHDPTPAIIRQGRGFLYDAKLSGGGLVSCASCHIDSEMDLLAWDLGNPQGNMETNRAKVSASHLVAPPNGISSNFVFHPMKGPMTTQTLRGMNGLEPLHWRGDRTNFLHFNGAFDGLMGGSELSAADMALYRDFINTIRFQPNPNQNLDRSLPTSFAGGNPVAGRDAYMNFNYQGSGALGLRCNTCHSIPTGTDKSFTPAAALQEPQHFKVPHLRNIYQKMTFTNAPGAQTIAGYGLVHEGSDPSLFAFMSRSVFGALANDTVRKRDISAFVQCFDTGTAPAVGYARTLAAANVSTASLSNDWNMLEAQAAGLTNINLVVKGTYGGAQRGFLYQPASNNYRADTTNIAALTRVQLRAAVMAGDALTVMGVPVGSGTRLGIDRNENGILDGDEPRPTLRIAKSGANAVVAWPTNRPGYYLERSATLPSAIWNPDTTVRGVVGTNFNVTNSLTATNFFFRLRAL